MSQPCHAKKKAGCLRLCERQLFFTPRKTNQNGFTPRRQERQEKTDLELCALCGFAREKFLFLTLRPLRLCERKVFVLNLACFAALREKSICSSPAPFARNYSFYTNPGQSTSPLEFGWRFCLLREPTHWVCHPIDKPSEVGYNQPS